MKNAQRNPLETFQASRHFVATENLSANKQPQISLRANKLSTGIYILVGISVIG